MTNRPDRKDGENKKKREGIEWQKKNSPRKKNEKRGRYKIKIKGGRKESVIKNSHNLRVNHAFQAIYVEKCTCKRKKKEGGKMAVKKQRRQN